MSSDFDSTDDEFEDANRRQQQQGQYPPEKTISDSSSKIVEKCEQQRDSSTTTTSMIQVYPKGVLGFSCELAKSSRSECKTCRKKISKGLLKLGVIVGEGKWGPVTCWHHVECLILQGVSDADEIDGYEDLDEDNARILNERIIVSAGLIDENYRPINSEELVRKEWTEPLETPSELLMPLLPYQNEGLGWLRNQENTEFRGGILADEMGMGKTIQAIGLMLIHRPNNNKKKKNIGGGVTVSTHTPLNENPVNDDPQSLAWSKIEESMGRTPDLSKRGGTLVICPMIAMLQWRTELEKFVKPGTLRITLHHGSKRTTLASDLTKYDVVITTYPIVEAEYRKIANLDKVICPDCGKHLYPEKLLFHRKYFCGEIAQRTEAQAKTFKKKKSKVVKMAHAGSSTTATVLQDNDDDDKGGTGALTTTTTVVPSSSKRISPTTTTTSIAMSSSEPHRRRSSNHNHKLGSVLLHRSSRRDNNTSSAGSPFRTVKPDASAAPSTSSSDNDDDEIFNLTILDGPPLQPRSSKIQAASQISEVVSVSRRHGEKRDDWSSSGSSEYATGTSEDTDDGEDTNHNNNSDREGDGGCGDWDVRRREEGERRRRRRRKTVKKEESEEEEDTLLIDISSSVRTTTLPSPPTRAGFSINKQQYHKHHVIPAPLLSVKTSTTTIQRSKKMTPRRKKRKGDQYLKWDDEEEDKCGGSVASSSISTHITSKTPTSVLQEVSWFRIILDESHYIKDRSSSTAKAVFRLTSLNKLCLTGTPLQNRVSELFSQIRFLRVDPYAYYMCNSKGCECKMLEYKFPCENCGHGPMQHYNAFNRHILNPISRTGYVGDGRKAFLALKDNILDKVLMRRTKESRNQEICLPPRIVRIRVHELSEMEEDFYQALYTQGKAQFDTYVTQGVVMHNVSHLFDVLIRLRQALDHPYLIVYSSTKREGMNSVGSGILPPFSSHSSAQEENNNNSRSGDDGNNNAIDEDCVVCHNPADQPVQARCGDVFCKACVFELADIAPNDAVLECPSCSEPLTVDLSSSSIGGVGGGASNSNDGHSNNNSGMVQHQQRGKAFLNEKQQCRPQKAAIKAGKFRMTSVSRNSIIHSIDLSTFQSSTKIEALIQELESMMVHDPCSKAIVFSQFVSFLDLIEYRIKIGGIDCQKLSGHMSVDARDTALNDFRSNSDVKVLLISLKAGGVALNLTCASRVFLMDPWWNPAAENQAIDRIHRIGQYKPIHAVRFIIGNSIEERIIKLQEKKKLVFDSTIGGDAGSLARLTFEDLQFLFKPSDTR